MATANSTKPALIPAVSYIRMSSEHQEDSPDQQRAEILKLAERGGYHLIREYFDSAISGDATERRTAFLQMREAAATGEFRTVLCWDQDRFGRFDPIEGGFWILPFRNAGVKLHTVAQGVVDWTDFQGRLLWFVQQEGKHAFLRDLSRNVLRGHRDGAIRGEWQGGPAPYGFTLEPIPGSAPRKNGTQPKRLVPHPDQAPVVRRIFAMYDAGQTLREIAGTLTAEGVPAPQGGIWRFETVRRRLVDEAYIGTYVWNSKPAGKYNHVASGEIVAGSNSLKVRQFQPNPDQNIIRIEHVYEPIMEPALFERCRRRLTEQQRQTSPFRKAENPYVLAGLCRCGHCGGSLIGQRADGRKIAARVYTCATYKDTGNHGCHRNPLPETEALRCLVRKLQDHFLDVAHLDELRAEVRRQCQPSKPACCGADVAKLQAHIDKLSKQIDQGAGKLLQAPASLTAVLTSKLQAWQTERDELRNQLQAHQTPKESTAVNVDEITEAIIAELQTLREGLNETEPALLRAALGRLVSKVEWFFERVPMKSGKRFRYVVRRGMIHLRPDLKMFRLETSDLSSVVHARNFLANLPRRASSFLTVSDV